ncbi:MAG: hypothetical protein KAS99_03690 [Candidatus Omnitrophica bacterium]|nr:hypothetical protein [Candidatus Omnitrophota bacterium]
MRIEYKILTTLLFIVISSIKPIALLSANSNTEEELVASMDHCLELTDEAHELFENAQYEAALKKYTAAAAAHKTISIKYKQLIDEIMQKNEKHDWLHYYAILKHHQGLCLASIYMLQERNTLYIKKAIIFYEEAMEIDISTKKHRSTAHIMCSLADAYMVSAQEGNAREKLTKAINIYKDALMICTENHFTELFGLIKENMSVAEENLQYFEALNN